MQSACCQPDAQSVVHEDLDAVASSVGKEVGMVGVGCAKNGDDACQCAVGACSHVQWGSGQPGWHQPGSPQQLTQKWGALGTRMKGPMHSDIGTASVDVDADVA